MLKNKVLFILHLPPPIHGATIVGKCIYDSDLVKNSFDSDYINLTTSRELSDMGKEGYRKLLIFIKLYYRVLKAVAKKRYDLCYLTINSKGAGYYKEMVIVLILKLFRCKIIYHYHNKGIVDRQNNFVLNLLYRFQFKNSRVILLSPLLYDDVKKYLPPDKVYYCPNGIPVSENIDLAKLNEYRISKHIPEILFISNIMADKGVFILLNASKKLIDQNIKFKVTFIGDWLDISESELNNYISSNELKDYVSFEGKKFGVEKSFYLLRADIFVHPTLNDCFPLTVLEAMQYGLPIVSTFEGGIPDMLTDGECGYLVNKNDEKKLSEKMKFLIENPYERQLMGQAAKFRFDEFFTIQIFENNLVKVLKLAIQDNSQQL